VDPSADGNSFFETIIYFIEDAPTAMVVGAFA
jgi:hypothetical protein